MFKAIASSALKASSQRGSTRLINRGQDLAQNQKTESTDSYAGGEWDVLKASRSKERSRLAGRDPSLRLAVLLVDLGSDRREVSGLSATKVCNKTVRKSARWLTHWPFQMADATFVSHASHP